MCRAVHDKSICRAAQTRSRIPREFGPAALQCRTCAEIPSFHLSRIALSFFSAGACAAPAFAQSPLPTASAQDRAEARAIFKQLIEINTTDTPLGNVTTATAAMEKRFLDAGFPAEDVHLLGPDPRKQNLVVRLRAAGTPTEKPVLFLCHMDVVEALPPTGRPIRSVCREGRLLLRPRHAGHEELRRRAGGTFLRLHREGYKPRRDLILALTADEEGGKFNGADWLVRSIASWWMPRM